MKYNVVSYQFGTGQTIEAAIKLVNNEILVVDSLKKLVDVFTLINGDSVPRLGSTMYLPVLNDPNPKFEVIEIERNLECQPLDL